MYPAPYIECHVEEEDKIATLLKSLPKDFDKIVTVLKEKELIPYLESVISSLQEAECKLHEAQPSNTTENSAYVVTTDFPKFQHYEKSNHQASKCFKVMACDKCGKKDHILRTNAV